VAADVTWHPTKVQAAARERLSHARGSIIWLTGLSGCGKSTIAMALEQALVNSGHMAYTLDGDNIRHGLNSDLGFSDADRTENIRRIGHVARLFADAGLLCIASFISPFRKDRESIRALAPGAFIEIFVDAPLAVCEQRDPKGLYRKARAAIEAGRQPQFTGIDSPYEPPAAPDLHLHTATEAPQACVEKIVQYLRQTGRLLPLKGNA
jgi:adenylylsulfate kinase